MIWDLKRKLGIVQGVGGSSITFLVGSPIAKYRELQSSLSFKSRIHAGVTHQEIGMVLWGGVCGFSSEDFGELAQSLGP